MKIIVEYDTDGSLYVYRETEKRFKENEKWRLGLKRLDNTDNECKIWPGTYIVVNGDYAKIPKVIYEKPRKNNRKNVAGSTRKRKRPTLYSYESS